MKYPYFYDMLDGANNFGLFLDQAVKRIEQNIRYLEEQKRANALVLADPRSSPFYHYAVPFLTRAGVAASHSRWAQRDDPEAEEDQASPAMDVYTRP